MTIWAKVIKKGFQTKIILESKKNQPTKGIGNHIYFRILLITKQPNLLVLKKINLLPQIAHTRENPQIVNQEYLGQH